jgi:hypothetical protein
MSEIITLTIDSTKVPATLTDFPVYVNLADMPAEFWNTVKEGGGDIRVYKADGVTELAREVVSCVKQSTAGVDIITASGTYTIPAGVTEITVEAWGGGGGGGDGANTGGGGGGGGAYASKTFTVTPLDDYTVTIGAGGSRATTSVGAGGTGGDTSFGTDVIAKGGAGGSGANSANAAGGAGGSGAGSTGTTTYSGGNGGTGLNAGDLGGGGGGAAGATGVGGNASNQTAGTGTGEGGSGGVGGANAGSGADGSVPGGGGGGGENNSAGSTGNGARGQIKVSYTLPTPITVEEGELHFLADSISHTTDTEFKIVVDGVSNDYAVTDTYGRNAVWADYEAVYHLQSLATDATVNANTLTNNNSVANATGKMYDGADSGASNTNKKLSTTNSLNVNGDAVSISSWFYPKAVPASGGRVTVSWHSNNTSIVSQVLSILHDGTSPKAYFGYERHCVASYAVNSSTTIAVDTWYHGVYTYDNTDVRGYLDGSSVGSIAASGNGTCAGFYPTGFNILGNTRNQEYLSGIVDEVRVTRTVLSANWITAEYNNQSSPSTFYTATAAGGGGGAPRNPLFFGGGL